MQGAAAGLALIVAFVPRRRDVVDRRRARAPPSLIALQLGVTHWFYLYIVWFFPLVMVALLGFYPERVGALEMATRSEAPAPAPARSPARIGSLALITTALSHGSSAEVSNRIGILVTIASSACSRLTPITPPRGPGHPDVGDVGGAARQHPGVRRRNVRVRPDHRRHAAVEVPAHPHLLAGRLGVHVDEHVVDLALERVQRRVGLAERRAVRRS